MSVGIPKAGGKMEEWSVREDEKQMKKKFFPSTNIQVFPFQQIWSKSIIYCRLPISHLRATQFPLWVIHLLVDVFCVYLSSSSGAWGARLDVLLLQYFQLAAAISQLWTWAGRCLWSCWEKSLRTSPTLNFQQRRENTSTVIQLNVVLFSFSQSHISFKSLCNNVTHTHTRWFIDYIMSPAVMFQSHVQSLIV